MRRLRFGPVLVAATLASAAFIPIVATPAGAALANGCTIAQWPNIAGGESGLKVACTETTATGSAKGGSAVPAAGQETRLEDFNQAQWHFGAARSGTASAADATGTSCIDSTDLHLAASDVNHGISGVGIPARAFISAFPGVAPCTAAQANLDIAIVAPGVSLGGALLVENSDGRSVTDGITTSGAGNKVCSATANFRAADALAPGRIITGTNIKHLTHIIAAPVAGCAAGQTGATVTAGGILANGAAQTITIGADMRPISATAGTTTTRQVHDVTISGNNTLCSATANFGFSDIQLPALSFSGGFLTGATSERHITAVAGAVAPCVAGQTKATLSAGTGVVTNGANQTVVIGRPNAAGPKNGDVSAILGAEIVLDPTLVAGQPRCDQHQPQGFNLIGTWTNPGSMGTGGFAASNSAPVNGQVIGEQTFPSSAINFGGFVINVKANTAGDSDTSAHTDIVFPGLPSGLAVCNAVSTTGVDASGVASTFQYLPTTLGIASAASGTGTPSTGSVRGLVDTGVAITGHAFMHLAVGTGATAFNTAAPGIACTTPLLTAAAMGTVACPANN
jgi:hypothetical protein